MVLRAVLESLPSESVVYPTERYFYYEFISAPRYVSGNLRFTDVSDGVLHVGYFDRWDDGWLKRGAFGAADGLDVSTHRDARGTIVSVAFESLRRDFRIPVRKLRCESYAMRCSERFISYICDESGIELDLLYHEELKYFYYLLRADWAGRDRLERIPTPQGRVLLFDPVSRFVFLDVADTGRTVLIGVALDEVRRNSYFDGPFDQVPPDLDIRSVLEQAYPYVKLRGGIDQHGNFNKLPGQRVAISPYYQYPSFEMMARRVDSLFDVYAEGPERWLSIINEPKRSVHQGLPQPWPANHTFDVSAEWASDHGFATSRAWPADHEYNDSSNTADDPREPR